MRDPLGISVVLVNWNGCDDLAECLASLEAQSDSEFETIVVDNGSTDASVDVVRRDCPSAVLIETGENLGFAEAANRGILAARRPWVALLNTDAKAHRDWIRELRLAARQGDARLGMLQSRIVFKGQIDRTNSTGVLIRPDGEFIDRDYDCPVRVDDQLEEVFCASAGAALYRRSMLVQLQLESGIFDRTFFMYYEDVDLGWRSRLAGFRAQYVPTAVVEHAFHGSSRRHGPSWVGLQCKRNRVRVLLKNASASYILRALPRLTQELVWAISKQGVAGFRAHVQAARDGIRQRAEVDRHLCVRREELERAWLQ